MREERQENPEDLELLGRFPAVMLPLQSQIL